MTWRQPYLLSLYRDRSLGQEVLIHKENSSITMLADADTFSEIGQHTEIFANGKAVEAQLS